MSDEPDLSDLLRQAMTMQEQILAAQAEANARTVEGRAGGGLVRVTMTGAGDVTAVSIAPDAIDPSEPELLEDLVLAAFRDAVHKVEALRSEAMGGVDLGALGLDIGGSDLGGGGPGGDPPGQLGPG